jgi:hypothetical protein
MPNYGNTPPILLAQNSQDRIVAPSTITRKPISPLETTPQITKETQGISTIKPQLNESFNPASS